MSEYVLRSDEVELYDGSVTFVRENCRAKLLLTNLCLVLVTTQKQGLFAKAEKHFTAFDVQEIKVYDGKPQLVSKGNDLRIFLLDEELALRFDSVLEVAKFKLAATKLLTGKTAQARGAEKVRDGIHLIDDTLGIDTVDTVKEVLTNGLAGTLLGGRIWRKKHTAPSDRKAGIDAVCAAGDAVRQAQNASAAASGNAAAGKGAAVEAATCPAQGTASAADETEQTRSVPALSLDAQVSLLKQFKSLLDAGILTEAEFAEKKRQILGR